MSFKPKPQRYANLFLEIANHKPTTILEIGTWKGDHAQQMINQALNYHPRIHYFGFDLFEEITDKQIKEENSKQEKAEFEKVFSKLSKIEGCKVNLITGNTKQTLKDFPAQPIDFIFIDGGHSIETIASDFDNIQKFIHKEPGKTVIIFDDYYPRDNTKGCKLLIDSLSMTKWQLLFLEPIDTFENDFKVQMVKVTRKI